MWALCSFDTAEKKETIREYLDDFSSDFLGTENHPGLFYAERAAFDQTIADQEKPTYFKGSTVITQSIYTLFCDIISIDFEALAKELYEIPIQMVSLRDPDYKYKLGCKIFKRLYKVNPYLVSSEILDSIFNDLSYIRKAYCDFADLNHIPRSNHAIEQLIQDYIKSHNDEGAKDPIEEWVKGPIEELKKFNNDYFEDLPAFHKIILIRKYIDELINGDKEEKKKLYSFNTFLPFLQYYIDVSLADELPESQYKDWMNPDDDVINMNIFHLTSQVLPFNRFLYKIYDSENKHYYSCKTLTQLLLCSFVNIINNHTMITICQHCGKYFAALNRSDTIYCKRKSPEDPQKTCGEYASYFNELEKNKKDEAKKLYRSIYNSLGNKYRRTNNEGLKTKISQLLKENKEWKRDLKCGDKTESEYIDWLNSLKKSRKAFTQI